MPSLLYLSKIMEVKDDLKTAEENKRLKNRLVVLLSIIITALIFGGGVYVLLRYTEQNLQRQIKILQNQINNLRNRELFKPEDSTQTVISNEDNSRIIYENDYLKIEILKTWNYQVVNNQSLNITKDNYILYINPNTTQSSGIVGGRFSEIGQGSPGVDLVMLYHPSEPCGDSVSKGISDKLVRRDYYIDKTDASELCNAPEGDDKLWYFSYVTTQDDGYFGNPKKLNPSITSQRQFVITMSYDGEDVNDLPVWESEVLNEALNEMTEMVKTVEFK